MNDSHKEQMVLASFRGCKFYIHSKDLHDYISDYVDYDKTDYQAIADEMNEKLFKNRDNHE